MRQVRAAVEAVSRFVSEKNVATGLAVFGVIVAAAAALTGFPRAERAAAADDHGAHHTDQAMRAEAEAYWAKRTPVGADAGEVAGGPAVTINVGNFFFDAGSPSQVDTARILVGESVLWQWVAGFHTITSGEDSFDPEAGQLFNRPSDSANPQFMFTFDSPGLYPYFCSFHEFQNMFGFIEVAEPASVPPGGGATLGFARDPAPNPSTAGVSFRYALPEPGPVRAEVFDAGGRRVAVLVKGDMPAGTHAAAWDGRTPSGLADTDIYYIRLRLPGYDQSRTVVIRR
jgi:plastocyanin